MNYKTIDVADVIGALFYSNVDIGRVSPSDIINVLSVIHERDKFICIDMSKSAYLRVIDIADGDLDWSNDIIHFGNYEACKPRFLGCYYSVDNQTRSLLDAIVGELKA